MHFRLTPTRFAVLAALPFFLGLTMAPTQAQQQSDGFKLAGEPPEADQLVALFQAEQKLLFMRVPGLTPLEGNQRFNATGHRLRELLLSFLEKYPNDPRRWIMVDQLYPTLPQFIKDWGPLNNSGAPEQPVYDEVAAAAWKEKITALRAEMEKASDIPEELRKTWAEREQAKQKRLAKTAAFIANARAGKPAPDFVMQDLAGREVKLSDFRGKVVVLDFWATWCGPCKAAMPHTQEVAARFKDQGVVVLASCTNDPRDKFESWVGANQARYPDILWAHDPLGKGEERASKKLYDVLGIPTQFIINREGRIVDAVLGYQKGEVLLDAALARAGIPVDAATLAKAVEDLKRREG